MRCVLAVEWAEANFLRLGVWPYKALKGCSLWYLCSHQRGTSSGHLSRVRFGRWKRMWLEVWALLSKCECFDDETGNPFCKNWSQKVEANPSDAKYAQVWLSRLWNKFPRDTYWQLQGLCCPYTGLPTNIYALLQIGTTRPVFVWRPSGWEVVGCSHAQWIERETQRVRRKFYDCSTISVLGGEKSIDRSIHSTHSDSIRDFF